jgi:hypothetical protein
MSFWQRELAQSPAERQDSPFGQPLQFPPQSSDDSSPFKSWSLQVGG